MRRHKLYVQHNADVFLAMSGKAAEALRIEGVEQQRIRMHFPGIDLQHFCPQSRPGVGPFLPWRRDDTLRILLVGNIVPSKGVREFILAAAEVVTRRTFTDRVEFALVGNGDVALVSRMVTRLGLQDVVVHQAAIPYADMPRLHASADLFVLPSIPTPVWEEQFGMVLAESMACGKPVISTHSGAIPEVVGDAGVLVPPYDHHALADAIIDLGADETRRIHLGERAAVRARDMFDREDFTSYVHTVYQNLLG